MEHLQTVTITPSAKRVSLVRLAAKYDQRTVAAVAEYMRQRGIHTEIEQVGEHLYRVLAA